MLHTISERCLIFKYAGEDKVQNSKNLITLLERNKIDFVCYIGTDNYYPCQFTVRRSGKKWNDIMKLINSIYSPKYDYAKSNFYITEELRRENVFGNIQEVVHCN